MVTQTGERSIPACTRPPIYNADHIARRLRDSFAPAPPVPASYRHARVAHPREKRSLPDAPEAVFRHPSTHRTDPAMAAEFTPFPPLAQLAADLAAGRTTSRALVETALERIADPARQGAVAFMHVDADSARAAADAHDRLRAAGTMLSPLARIPLSVKDLFDIEGQTTRAGSVGLADAPPANPDRVAVARLNRAGAVIVGRTNMSEFAFSGLGR